MYQKSFLKHTTLHTGKEFKHKYDLCHDHLSKNESIHLGTFNAINICKIIGYNAEF